MRCIEQLGLPAVRPHDLPHQMQPHAAAVAIPSLAAEGFEDLRPQCVRHARPAVDYIDRRIARDDDAYLGTITLLSGPFALVLLADAASVWSTRSTGAMRRLGALLLVFAACGLAWFVYTLDLWNFSTDW